MYIAIIDYNKESDAVRYAIVSHDMDTVAGVYWKRAGLLGNELMFDKDVIPVNFSVDNCKLVEDWGKFERLWPGCGVVLAVVKNQSGKTVGYRVLNTSTLVIGVAPVEEVLHREEELDGTGRHLLHNAIIRNGKVDCYAGHKFIEQKMVRRSVIGGRSAPQPASERNSATAVSPREMAARRNELELANRNGVDISLISNPELNSRQMRVLWVSKSKGALSEYFNDPRLSVESMRFYADRIYSRKIADACRPMIERPTLDTSQLEELYLCIAQGVEYRDLLDSSAVDIRIARERRGGSYWGNSELLDDEVLRQKAIGALNYEMFH